MISKALLSALSAAHYTGSMRQTATHACAPRTGSASRRSMRTPSRVTGWSAPWSWFARPRRSGSNVLCITDHDTISELGPAIEVGAALGVEVVRGEEVTASFPPGIHIVGLFLERQIRMHMSVEDTVDAIHDAGGLAVIAHPFMPTWFASMTPGRARTPAREPPRRRDRASPYRTGAAHGRGGCSTRSTPSTGSGSARRSARGTATSASTTWGGC